MLVLTRRVGEKLVISDNIEVIVLGVKDNQVKLGIGAPDNISIYREEVYQRIQQERLNKEKTS